MSIINKGTSFANGEQLTADKINDLIDLATFNQDATDSQTTDVNSAGQIVVNQGGIDTAQLATDAVKTVKIKNANVTFAKLTDVIDDDTMATATDTTLATSESIKAYVDGAVSVTGAYPVGSIYINASDSRDPSVIFGFGTWAPFGAGRVPVGIDSTDNDFDAVGVGNNTNAKEGSKTHTLQETEMPIHSHSLGSFGNNPNAGNFTASSSSSNQSSRTTGTAGGGEPHNNLQPYVVVYMWKRTA